MSFSYGPDAIPPTFGPIDQVRLLLADTALLAPDGVSPGYIFSDEEILGAYGIQRAMIWGVNLPISPLRVAALLLTSLAGNFARLISVTKILDVTLSARSAKDMLAQAKLWIDLDDNFGGFVVIEQVTTDFAFRDRWFAQAQRVGAVL